MKRIILAFVVSSFSLFANADPVTDCTVNGAVDWACVCSNWCQNGLGGAACNCEVGPI